MYDTDELRAELLAYRIQGDTENVRRIQNIMCDIYTRCDLCRACLGWRRAEQGHSGRRTKYEL